MTRSESARPRAPGGTGRRRALHAPAVGLACALIALFGGSSARAQADAPEPEPEAEEAATATVAPAAPVFEPEPPATGLGSLVSPEEAEPMPPPTADEVSVEGEEAVLKALSRELGYYEQGAASFVEDQQASIRGEYEAQRDQLSRQYEARIEALEEEERERRLDAIARFEAFLRKYPDQPTYTPDAMFRLAELYFERSSDEFLQESRAYEDELLAWESGGRASEPRPPEPRFDDTIALHRDLLGRFPNYRLADAARYLLGYAYGEMGQEQEALLAYQSLVDNHPGSQFVPEVWTRIGEIYFDGNTRGDLEQAVAAYENVLRYEDSPYYDKALYKIAWTHYRLDEFDEAVENFVALVRFADEQKAATGVTGSELRAEAIQYIAISLADELWGGFDTARAKLAPVEDEAFAQELWKRYGEVLFEQTRYDQAVRVLSYTLDRYPNAPSNPEAQAKIVQAYEQLRDFDAATRAREALVARYGEGSGWAEANAGNEEALAQAASLTERSLSTAALFRHEQAQRLRAQGDTARSKSQYRAAASAYADYLERFPRSNRSYDFNFFLAETLYYSDDFDRAASQYAMVRDSTVDSKHLETAALFAVISHERRIENLEAKGELDELEVMTAAQRSGRPVEPRDLPPARKNLVEASDRFVELAPTSENVAAIAYRAAEEYYKHDRFDEARGRFERIVAEYPEEQVAQFAANLIIESYLAVEDWERVDEWSGRLIQLAQGGGAGGPRGELVDGLEDVRLKAQFKIAERLNADDKFEEAANAYVELVDANPESEVADKALFNAAVAYEKVNRFDTASKVYRRIHEDYPGSELAPRALFRVGINADKGFDFASAIDAYQTLVERYPKSEDRADALYNVAVVLENMQQYEKAAEAYKNYATTFRSRPDAGEVFFRSALVYAKMEAWGRVTQTLDEFVRAYRRAPQERARIVRAYLERGKAEQARERNRSARQSYDLCVQEFARLRLRISSKAGGYAAQCAFRLAEYRFEDYDDIAITGNERQQVEALRRKAAVQQQVEKAYASVVRYKRLEQTLAAFYRIGHSYERFADALFTAPVPKALQRDPELADEYRAQLEDRAAILEQKAEAAYRKAYQEARQQGVTNQWTRRILEGLNKFAPAEFPIQKRGKPALLTDFISGHGLEAESRRTERTGARSTDDEAPTALAE